MRGTAQKRWRLKAKELAPQNSPTQLLEHRRFERLGEDYIRHRIPSGLCPLSQLRTTTSDAVLYAKLRRQFEP